MSAIRTEWIPEARTKAMRESGFIVCPLVNKAGQSHEKAMQKAQQLLADGHASVGIYRLSQIVEKDTAHDR